MGDADDRWTPVAEVWSELWTGFVAPVWDAVADATRIGPGTRVLDVGCGSGEFLAHVRARGAVTSGADPSTGMLALARAHVPDADLRASTWDALPWPDDGFDVVTAFNALQFADDPSDALAEAARVAVPGGLIAISNWAEAARNDLRVIEDALTAADGEEPAPDGELRPAGGLERAIAGAGLELVTAGVIDLPWELPDGDTLARAVLMGEDPARAAEARPVILDAARPFARPDGGYLLVNAFRFAVARARTSTSP